MEREDIARLFAGETIFLAGKSEQIVSGKKEAAIIDSGKDNPGLAIVLSDPAKITSEQRELLHNILKAINRDPSEVPLITPSRFDELSSGKYLCFGDACRKHISEHAAFYELHEVDGRSCLFSDDLNRLAENRELKLQLWNSLKNHWE